ncbi:MAG: adenine-specific methyltransferase EcoRI family protein [Selenomonadaceae bacterium]|nr:adenine-specific methyltransferase EcoRI family protein [Selenomonadaceae bacterium]MBR1858983.1 adenine-specific methyltransferase EcoRI family protein [Selenomonadaceae bacterium]
MANKNLNNANKAKKDEFYTNLTDIEDEVFLYKSQFAGKTIFCNCDDPFESNFFFYFAMQFNFFKLKKLIASSYAGSPIAYNLFEPTDETKIKPAYMVELNEIKNTDGRDNFDFDDIKRILNDLKSKIADGAATDGKNKLSILKGDGHYAAGDFRSKECVALLKQSDIVVTNPPFSLFREFVAQLVDYDKKFLMIGNLNNIKYKDILPLFMRNKIWLGYNSGHLWFKVPASYEEKATDFKIDTNGQKWRRMGNIGWFTNLDVKKRHEEFMSYKNYNPQDFPKYDNYDAIEVSKTADIPKDYNGIMGVPITFMDKYNPDQFEILGVLNSGSGNEYDYAKAILYGKQLYARILIRRRIK